MTSSPKAEATRSSELAHRVDIAACEFYVTPTKQGWWVGRCKQFPALRSKAFRNSLDALDEVTEKVAAHVREINCGDA